MMIRLSITLLTLAVLTGLVLGVSDFGVSDNVASVVSLQNSPSAEPSFDGGVNIVFVGDIMLSRHVGKFIKANNDPSFPFRNVSDFLHDADITFGNLENPVSNRGRNVGSIYSFRADPLVAEALSFAGFDVLSIANNHIWDWGADALLDTISLLADNGIGTIGAGTDYKQANEVHVVERNGLRIGFYAFTNLLPKSLQADGVSPGLSEFNLEKIITRMQSDKNQKRLDRILISLHWGDEYETTSNELQKKIAHALVDGGADIIIGHHPHVVQEVERYNGSLILYSLGNFIFDQNFSQETMQGLVVRVTLSQSGIEPEYFTSYLNKQYQVEKIERR